MRVIAGEYRGRRLETIEGKSIRPTSDMVKESLFNILLDYTIDCTFLDLFAGSGSVGIEAISRGASNVIFIDSSVDSLKILRKNIDSLKICKGYEVYNADYKLAIDKLNTNKKSFDVIFIDPPYSKGIAQDAIVRIEKSNILNKNGIIAVEHDDKDNMPENLENLIMHKQRRYGNTRLSFYIYKDLLNGEVSHWE